MNKSYKLTGRQVAERVLRMQPDPHCCGIIRLTFFIKWRLNPDELSSVEQLTSTCIKDQILEYQLRLGVEKSKKLMWLATVINSGEHDRYVQAGTTLELETMYRKALEDLGWKDIVTYDNPNSNDNITVLVQFPNKE